MSTTTSPHRPTPTLHMMCGKIASGKSTLSAALGRQPHTVVLTEDDWLTALYPDELSTLSDYMRCTTRLRTAMGPHVVALLNAGVSVVLDFSANTSEMRAWMRAILAQTNALHHLHVLETPDAVCLARLARRNAGGDHPFKVTEAQFRQVTRHYAPPSPEEGFTIVHHETPPDA